MLKIGFEDHNLTAVTNNMELIDRINTSEDQCFEANDFQDIIDAKIEAIEFVLDKNGFEYSKLESTPSRIYARIYNIIY